MQRNLRKPGDKAYYIPRGGCFELVSGANFLGEIIEWFGFAIAVSCQGERFTCQSFEVVCYVAQHTRIWFWCPALLLCGCQ